MSGIFSFLSCCGVWLVIVASLFVLIWLAFGRKKRAEDKAVGGLELMAMFKAAQSVDCMQRRLR